MNKAKKITLAVLLPLLALTAWLFSTDFSLAGSEYWRSFSLLFAALGFTFIFMQFLLSSRVKGIERGIGLDSMMRLHRYSGRAGLILIFLHLLTIAAYRFAVFGELFPNIFIWAGLTALLGFSLTGGLASTYSKLGLHYEIFRNVHLINYLLFPLALVHVFFHTGPGSILSYLWVLIAGLFLALISYRVVKIIDMRKHPYEVVSVKQEAVDAWSLFFKGRPVDYLPGQFMFLQLLRDGKRSSPHPFTISSSPEAETLSVTPKELGDFTATIKNTRVGDKAFIDAPYGVFSFLNYPEEELVFLAGGIGITPFMSMLRYMRDRGINRKVTLIWGSRSDKHIYFRDELRDMEKELAGFKMVLVMSGQPNWTGEKGYVDAGTIKKHVGSLESKQYFVCGPPAMSGKLLESLEKAGVASSRIHSEIFAL